MSDLFASSILVIACLGFYQAGKKRASLAILKNSARMRLRVKYVSWGLALISFYMFLESHGWERGVPIWICILTLAGFSALLSSALSSTLHYATGWGALVLFVISGFGMLTGLGRL